MKEQYESIVKMCQELLDKGPIDPTLGICHSLSQRNGPGYYKVVSLLDDITETWPKFSGSCTYLFRHGALASPVQTTASTVPKTCGEVRKENCASSFWTSSSSIASARSSTCPSLNVTLGLSVPFLWSN